MFQYVFAVLGKLKVNIVFLVIGIILLTTQGCTFIEYRDVSDDPKYQHLIGTRYEVRRNLKIIGITLDPNYKKEIDQYSVKLRSFSGPEVMSSNSLHIGTIINIERVLGCSNCSFTKIIKYQISVQPGNFKEVPILMDDLSMNDGERVFLDREIFKKSNQKSTKR